MPDNEFEVPQPEGPPHLYTRQDGIEEINRYQTIAVVGAGGVGCWVALSLVLAGVTRVDIYDGDTISIHNLNRFPLPPGMVGEPKSLALARWLSSLRPDNDEINARGMFEPETVPRQTFYNCIICSTDSLKSRKMVYDYAKAQGSHYIEAGADGDRWSVSPAPPEFSTSLEAQAGYQSVPVHVGPCMMAAAAAVYYALHQTPMVKSHSGEFGSYYDVMARGLMLRDVNEGILPVIHVTSADTENVEPDPEDEVVEELIEEDVDEQA